MDDRKYEKVIILRREGNIQVRVAINNLNTKIRNFLRINRMHHPKAFIRQD